MVHILPAAPLGTTDQMSPIRAAVPDDTSLTQQRVLLTRDLGLLHPAPALRYQKLAAQLFCG
jgi:hypothetical protein